MLEELALSAIHTPTPWTRLLPDSISSPSEPSSCWLCDPWEGPHLLGQQCLIASNREVSIISVILNLGPVAEVVTCHIQLVSAEHSRRSVSGTGWAWGKSVCTAF